MNRIHEFEQKLDALLAEFSDVDSEELAESLEYYANMYFKRDRA